MTLLAGAGLFAAGWASCLAAEAGLVAWLRRIGDRNARANRAYAREFLRDSRP